MSYLRKKILAAFLAGLSVSAYGGTPVKNKETMEANYIRCIENNFKDNCWENIFSDHFDKWQKNPEKVASVSQLAFKEWLGEKKVYKVHTVQNQKNSDIFDNRRYVVQRDDGALVGLHIGFRNVVGEWYVYLLGASPDDKFIRILLDMPDININ